MCRIKPQESALSVAYVQQLPTDRDVDTWGLGSGMMTFHEGCIRKPKHRSVYTQIALPQEAWDRQGMIIGAEALQDTTSFT